MPNTREKLIELIGSTEYGNGSLIGNNFQKGFIEKIADHLIANGVTMNVTDINVGDIVYALYSVEKYRMNNGSTRRRNWQIDTRKNFRMQKKYGEIEVREKKCTKTDMCRIGITVFKTKEEAERAIANG